MIKLQKKRIPLRLKKRRSQRSKKNLVRKRIRKSKTTPQRLPKIRLQLLTKKKVS